MARRSIVTVTTSEMQAHWKPGHGGWHGAQIPQSQSQSQRIHHPMCGPCPLRPVLHPPEFLTEMAIEIHIHKTFCP